MERTEVLIAWTICTSHHVAASHTCDTLLRRSSDHLSLDSINALGQGPYITPVAYSSTTRYNKPNDFMHPTAWKKRKIFWTGVNRVKVDMAGQNIRDRTREFFLNVQSVQSRRPPIAKPLNQNSTPTDVISRRKQFSAKAAQVRFWSCKHFCRDDSVWVEIFYHSRAARTFTEQRTSWRNSPNVTIFK